MKRLGIDVGLGLAGTLVGSGVRVGNGVALAPGVRVGSSVAVGIDGSATTAVAVDASFGVAVEDGRIGSG